MTEYYYTHIDSIGNVEEKEMKVLEENRYVDEDGSFKKYEEMLNKIQRKDVVYIYHITDLGDDFPDIMMRWSELFEEKRVHIVTLSKPIIDTRKMKYSRLEYFIYILHLTDKVDSLKERSRKQIKAITKAKKSGIQIGKPRKYTLDEFEEEYGKLAKKGLMDKEISEILEIHPATCSRYKRRIEERKKEG